MREGRASCECEVKEANLRAFRISYSLGGTGSRISNKPRCVLIEISKRICGELFMKVRWAIPLEITDKHTPRLEAGKYLPSCNSTATLRLKGKYHPFTY